LNATAPFCSAVTLNGRVRPQMPGPDISFAGWIYSLCVTRRWARQVFSACARQAGRVARSYTPQPATLPTIASETAVTKTRRVIQKDLRDAG
jgi:hypothetical protein